MILASLTLPFLGCGGDDDDRAQTVEPTTTEQEEDASTTTTSRGSSDLNDVVVQLDDLPTGWSVTPPEEDDETDDEICDGQDPFNEIEPQDEAESGFQQSDFGPFVASFASEYADDDEAGEVLSQFVEAANACQSFTETDEDGTETEYTISPLSFPDLGDETFAFKMSATSFVGPFTMDIAVIREGQYAVGIFNGGIGAPPDSELMESLAETMLGRL